MVSNRLWPHPAWAQHLRTLSDAGARFVDPVTGLVGSPGPVSSGTGPEVVEGFDAVGLAKIVGPATPSARDPDDQADDPDLR